MHRIESTASVSMSSTIEMITLTSATADVASGLHLTTTDDLGFTHHFFQHADGRVWFVAFPEVNAGSVSGTPVEMDRPDWADTIVEATALL